MVIMQFFYNLTSATKYFIWLKTLHFINDILRLCKCLLYFIAFMSKLFSVNTMNFMEISINGG